MESMVVHPGHGTVHAVDDKVSVGGDGLTSLAALNEEENCVHSTHPYIHERAT